MRSICIKIFFLDCWNSSTTGRKLGYLLSFGEAWLQIAKLIGNEDKVPEYVDHDFIKIDSTILKQYTGTYELMPADSESFSPSGSKFRISIKGNHLVAKALDSSGTVRTFTSDRLTKAMIIATMYMDINLQEIGTGQYRVV